MGLVSFLCSLYFVFMIVLLFKRNTMDKVFVIFGGLTFGLVIIYSLIPAMPKQVQTFGIFIVFSLMIILFGMMFGLLLKLFNRKNMTCTIVSIIMTSLLIGVLFNIKGYLSYAYIPVLMYMIQVKLNNYIDKCRTIHRSIKVPQ